MLSVDQHLNNKQKLPENMTTKKVASRDPKEKGSDKDISRPKKPDNDPDQTPNREVKNPPQADPQQNPPNPAPTQNPAGTPNSPKSGFQAMFSKFFLL
jgi:hypothetical protein